MSFFYALFNLRKLLYIIPAALDPLRPDRPNVTKGAPKHPPCNRFLPDTRIKFAHKP